jgi:outer membrane protein OmpA-like peptidoglycan-associated protein
MEARMNTIVGWMLVAGPTLSLGAGCAHDGKRPRATIVAVGNADPTQVPRDPAHHRMGFVRVFDDATAINRPAAARENENKYGQLNMIEPNADRAKDKRLARAYAGACDQTIYFGSGSSALSPRAKSELRDVARCLSNETGHATIVGRTDPSGTSAGNLTLGTARANAVANYLESLGVAQNELAKTSLGESGASLSLKSWATDRQANVEIDRR